MRSLSNYISWRVIVGFLWNVHELTYPTWLAGHVQAYARFTFSEEVKLLAGRIHCHGVWMVGSRERCAICQVCACLNRLKQLWRTFRREHYNTIPICNFLPILRKLRGSDEDVERLVITIVFMSQNKYIFNRILNLAGPAAGTETCSSSSWN